MNRVSPHRDGEPHLAFDVVGGPRFTRPQIAREARLEIAIQHGDRSFVAALRCRQYGVEVHAPRHQEKVDHPGRVLKQHPPGL